MNVKSVALSALLVLIPAISAAGLSGGGGGMGLEDGLFWGLTWTAMNAWTHPRPRQCTTCLNPKFSAGLMKTEMARSAGSSFRNSCSTRHGPTRSSIPPTPNKHPGPSFSSRSLSPGHALPRSRRDVAADAHQSLASGLRDGQNWIVHPDAARNKTSSCSQA